jgi:predicted Zn-dependent protease with MMP-like domain
VRGSKLRREPVPGQARDTGRAGTEPRRRLCKADRMRELDRDEFERLVVAELDELPDDMVDGLENVVFVVEDRPEDGTLDLLGLYDGVSLTERGQYGFGEMPDRIILYREPLLAVSEDEEQLRDEIHVTLVHEIAHFYGIDDDRLHELGWD